MYSLNILAFIAAVSTLAGDKENLKVAYKTTNTIKHHLKPRSETGDIYSRSGVYQLQWGECPLKYVGQTGRKYRILYREHIKTIWTNRQNSKFA
jgi:hypothetical protein